MKLVNTKKAPIWVDLVICGPQPRYFNHWALITFDQTDWYNQVNKNSNCHLVHVTVWMKSKFMGSQVPYFQCKSDVFCMPFRNWGMYLTHIALIDYAFSETDLPLSLCIHKSSKTWLPFTKSMQYLSASFGQHATLKKEMGCLCLKHAGTQKNKIVTTSVMQNTQWHIVHVSYNVKWLILNKKSINWQWFQNYYKQIYLVIIKTTKMLYLRLSWFTLYCEN